MCVKFCSRFTNSKIVWKFWKMHLFGPFLASFCKDTLKKYTFLTHYCDLFPEKLLRGTVYVEKILIGCVRSILIIPFRALLSYIYLLLITATVTRFSPCVHLLIILSLSNFTVWFHCGEYVAPKLFGCCNIKLIWITNHNKAIILS